MEARTKCYKAKIENLTNDGSYVAYISTFGDKDNVDRDGDFFKSTAFDKTIKKRKGLFPGVFMHDLRRPVAAGEVHKDSRGLIVESQINLETKDGQETYSNMKAKIMGDHSIGFNVNWKKSEDLKDENGRITGFGFGEVELLEFSPVLMGLASNEQANLIALKWRDASRGESENMTFDDLIKELMASHGDEFNEKYMEIVDSDIPLDVDSIEQAKAMAEFLSGIKDMKQIIKSYERR